MSWYTPEYATPKENAPAATEATKETQLADASIAAQKISNTPDLSEAHRLFSSGFALCKLRPNTKRPEGDDWNNRPIQRFDHEATGYGVMLATNKLCSIDPDNAELSTALLAGFGFDLDVLLNAGVRSISTRAGSGGRSAFKADPGLRKVVFAFKDAGTVLELRAHSANLQDTIPGLIYADKHGELCTQRYASDLRLDEAPDLPPDFLAWWLRMSTDLEFKREQQRRAGEILGIKAFEAASGSDGKTLAFRSGMRSGFNASNSVPEILERHGYTGDGVRFAPPTATGLPGVREILGKDGLWQSDHASDPLCGMFDAWAAYVVLDHDGDQVAAEAAWLPIVHQVMADDFSFIEDISDLLGSGEDPAPRALPSFERTKAGEVLATKENVVKAVTRPDVCGWQLRHDVFRDETMLSPPNVDEWRAFKDTDYTELCMRLERGDTGFKDIPKERIRDAVAYVADANAFDSAEHWLGLQVWDGVRRVETFLPRCFGAEDTPYTRAVGLYLWTAMAGRVMKPGIKADMVPVAVGPQGAKKSSAVAAIVPSPDFFLELDLGSKDDDLARLMRGKLVIELGELKGLRAREVEHVKAFITRQHEEWTPKYREMQVRYARRCVFFGTTNKDEFLADDTGNRRWLP
ncbi:MAG: hypothetical protein K0B16_08450, partial [Burkholderiaceae bacterium]|nr:hypothetical protein [Burkholderiaceae bacterium]